MMMTTKELTVLYVLILVILGIIFSLGMLLYVSYLEEIIDEKQLIIDETEAEAKLELERQMFLNQDKDNDGLTLAEEQRLGSSDDNPDSDNDGVPDFFDGHPVGGGRYIPKTFQWAYNGEKLTITTRVHEDWYDYKRKMPKSSLRYEDYVGVEDPMIEDIAKQLRELMKRYGSACNSCFAVNFVQSLPYVKDAETGYDDYKKFPVETLVDGNGDCEDTAFLAASIIEAMGIDTILLRYEGVHVAVGVQCKNYLKAYTIYNGKLYCYLETTGEGWEFGQVPERYKDLTPIIIDV